MQVVLYVALTIAVVVIAGAFAVLVSGILRETRKLGRTFEDLSQLMKTTELELAETTKSARESLVVVDQLLFEVTDTVAHVDHAAQGIGRLVANVQAATSAVQLVRSSTNGLAGVYEGVKQGIRTLWGSHDTDKEGTDK